MSPSVPEMESLYAIWGASFFECVLYSVWFMYPEFTWMPGGVSDFGKELTDGVNDSGLYCFAPCLLSIITSLCLFMLSRCCGTKKLSEHSALHD